MLCISNLMVLVIIRPFFILETLGAKQASGRSYIDPPRGPQSFRTFAPAAAADYTGSRNKKRLPASTIRIIRIIRTAKRQKALIYYIFSLFSVISKLKRSFCSPAADPCSRSCFISSSVLTVVFISLLFIWPFQLCT